MWVTVLSFFWLALSCCFTSVGGVETGQNNNQPIHKDELFVVDIILFNHELEILFTRLHELYPVVDEIFIFEADRSFTGIAKDLIYQKNKAVYERFADKITHVAFPKMQDTSNCSTNHAFPCEQAYRRFAYTTAATSLVARGIIHNMVIYSDMDELPRRKVIRDLKRGKYKLPSTFVLDTYKYSMHWSHHPSVFAEVTTSMHINNLWSSCVSVGVSSEQKGGVADCLHKERFSSNRHPHIHDAGWHFSTFGSVEDMWIKCHATSDKDRRITIEEIKQRLRAGQALWTHKGKPIHRFSYTHIGDGLPQLFTDYPDCAREWLGRYSKGSDGIVVVDEPVNPKCGISFKKQIYVGIVP